jgi:hypothetical protein
MPLLMICPCGHAGELPELTGRFVCVICKKVLELNWFGAPGAYEQFQRWRIKSGQVAGIGSERPKVEYVQ